MTLVHWKAGAGRALCAVAEGAAAPAMPGEWLVRERAKVTCPCCLEWLHA